MLQVCQAAQTIHKMILRGQTHQLQSIKGAHQNCQNLVFPLLTALCASECTQLPVCLNVHCFCEDYSYLQSLHAECWSLLSIQMSLRNLSLSLLMCVIVQVFRSCNINLRDSVCESAECENTLLLSVVSSACRHDEEII